MITAIQSPIQQTETILASAYLPLEQVRLHRHCPEASAAGRQPADLSFESGIRQAIAVHNEALLESLPTPDADVLMQVIRDNLMAHGSSVNGDEHDDIEIRMEVGRRMLEVFLDSVHATLGDEEAIIGIEHDVSGFIGCGLPPVLGRADLVSLTAHGVVVTNYRIVEPEAVDQAVDYHAGELHLVGALVAGSVDEHSRLAGLRLVTITSGTSPTVYEHRISLDESRLQSMIEQIRSIWKSIVDQHTT